MRTLLLGLIFFLITTIANSKSFDKNFFKFNTDSLDFSTNEKVLKNKEFITKCMNFILSKEPRHLSTPKSKCFKVLLELGHNDTFNTSYIDFYPFKLTRGDNGGYRTVFEAILTKLRLERPELLKNDSLLAFESFNQFIDYYTNPIFKAHISKERRNIAELREKGQLWDYVRQIFVENEIFRAKQKPNVKTKQYLLVEAYKKRLNTLPPDSAYKLFLHRYSNGNIKMIALGKEVILPNGNTSYLYLDSANFYHKNKVLETISITDSTGRVVDMRIYDKKGIIKETWEFIKFNHLKQRAEFLGKFYINGILKSKGVYLMHSSQKMELISDLILYDKNGTPIE